MNIANRGRRKLHALLKARILLTRQHKRHRTLRINHLRQVLDRPLLRDRVERVQQLLALQRVFEALHDGFVAGAVVDDRVALAAVDELLDVRLRAARNGDQRVDVGFQRELESVVADGGGGAVDHQGSLGGLGGGEPGFGQAEARVKADCGGQGGEGDGGALWWEALVDVRVWGSVGWMLTLKADVLGQEESGVLPGDGVFGVAASGRHHFVEGSDSVALLELDNILANFVDDA